MTARGFAFRLAGGCLAAALLIAAGSDSQRTRDRPPPGHTGGFSEPTCQQCHFDADLNGGGGTLTVTGVPATYTPGATYTVAVELAQPGLRIGGFQLAARHVADGRQAGTLVAARQDSARLEVTTDGGVQYAHHTFAGTARVATDTARWVLRWTAPDRSTASEIVFHAVANAADDDDSPLGDFIYTTRSRHVAGPEATLSAGRRMQ